MKFNKNKYLKLLKELKFDFDKVKQKKKFQYLGALESEIYWRSRFEYLQMLNLFIHEVITMSDFTEQFMTLHFSNQKLLKIHEKNLEAEALADLCTAKKTYKNLYVDSRSIGFMKPIVQILSYLEVYEPDVDLKKNLDYPDLIAYGASEEYIRKRVKERFLPEIAAYCN